MLEKGLNILLVFIVSGILLGAYGVQFLWHEEPCPLCMLQRLGMMGVACSALLNLRFGVKIRHYGWMLLFSLFGGTVALRQISLHVCPDTHPFGLPVLGLSLYTWSFLVFVSIILGVALLLFLYDPKRSETPAPSLNGAALLACGLFFAIVVANVATTALQCGLGPCIEY